MARFSFCPSRRTAFRRPSEVLVLQRNTLKIGKQSPSLALVHTSTVVGLGKNKTPSKQTKVLQ